MKRIFGYLGFKLENCLLNNSKSIYLDKGDFRLIGTLLAAKTDPIKRNSLYWELCYLYTYLVGKKSHQ